MEETVKITKTQLEEVQYLDIGLVKSKGFIPKAIQFFMKRYAKTLGVKPERYYNHAFMVVNMWDSKWVAEAEAEGYVLRPFETTYLGKNTFKLGRIKGAKITKKVVSEVSKKAATMSFKQTRYDIWNFFWQIIKSYTGQWFRNDAKITKKLYCTEAVAVLANMIKADIFKEPGSVNPLDIDLNKNIEWVHDYIEE